MGGFNKMKGLASPNPLWEASIKFKPALRACSFLFHSLNKASFVRSFNKNAPCGA